MAIDLEDKEPIDYCGLCDKPLSKSDLLKSKYGIVQYNYPEEPNEEGYICEECIKKQEELRIQEDKYFDEQEAQLED